MDIIDGLNMHDPLHDRTELFTNWVDISKYKRFIITFSGDVMINIDIQFSCDENELKPVMFTSLACSPSGAYKYAMERIKLKYCRLKISNKTGSECKVFNLYFFGVDKVKHEKKIIFSEPLPSIKSESLESSRGLKLTDDSPKNRFKSPFKTNRPKSNLSEPGVSRGPPVKDVRIPDPILPNSLIYGTLGGSFRQLGTGLPSQVLTVDESGMPTWSFPYPPK